MRVQLLGTGSADGWPNPFCNCPSCASERSDRRSRAATSALIDDRILIDCGPTAATAAIRFGTGLSQVQHVLITHGHPDHLAPDFLLWRGWVRPASVLHLWAPPRAIDRCRDWVGPADTVVFHAIEAGDRLSLGTDLGQYSAHAIAATHHHGNQDALAMEAVLFDLSSPQGTSIFYATDTGILTQDQLESVRDRNFDLVLLDETFGNKVPDIQGRDQGHLTLKTFSSTIAALRGIHAISDTTDVIAVHLSHHNPPTTHLLQRLAPDGARVVDDGTILTTQSTGIKSSTSHHLIIGGARSGKSTYAEELAQGIPEVTYLATGYPVGDDESWRARVAAHQVRRPSHWVTLETIDLVEHLDSAATGCCLIIDCLGLWVTRILDGCNGWASGSHTQDAAMVEVMQRSADLGRALDQTKASVILVTNEVGLGVVPGTEAGRLFRDVLGMVNNDIARHCPKVTMMVAGRAFQLGLKPLSISEDPIAKELLI